MIYKTLKRYQCCERMNTNVDVNWLGQDTTSDTILSNIDGHFITFPKT